MRTLPGAKLLHEGQFDGRMIRLPVFLSRRQVELPDQDLQAFYQRLLTETARDVFRNGNWRLCNRSGSPNNASHRYIMAWCWELNDERYLILVNFSGIASQTEIRMYWDDLRGSHWRLSKTLSTESYERGSNEMDDSGLFVSLQPWKWHCFQLQSVSC